MQTLSRNSGETPFSLSKATLPLAFSNHFVSSTIPLPSSTSSGASILSDRLLFVKAKAGVCRLLRLPLPPPRSAQTLLCAPMGGKRDRRRNLGRKRHKLKAQNVIKLHIYFFTLQDNICSIFTNGGSTVQLSAQGYIAGKDAGNPDPSASKAYPPS